MNFRVLAGVLAVAVAMAAGAMAQPVPGQPYTPSPMPASAYGMENFRDRLLSKGLELSKFADADPQQRLRATQLAQQLSLPCQPTHIAAYGSRSANGARAAAEAYELACQEGPGWVVMAPRKGTPEAFDCVALATLSKGGKETFRCRTPQNTNLNGSLQSLVAKVKVACTVDDAAWHGGGGNPPVWRYEVGCSEGGGYVLDAPAPASMGTLQAVSCIEAASLNVQCQLTPKAEQVAAVAAVVAKGKVACKATDARFVAGDAQRQYYEVACADRANLVVEANGQGGFVRAIECNRAAQMGAACTLTSGAAPRS